MLEILYNLFIFPIEQIIGLCYVFTLRIFNDPALSIIGVSFAISVLLLPFYFKAEKYQLAEQEIKNRLKPVVDNIKAAFSGNERFMRLSTYYRQNGYHPIYALRSSLSLFIQVPFFIAAYHYLANLDVIKNISFGPIADLAKQDALFTIGVFSINILPIAMALINCASAAVYAKGFAAKDKIQLYGIAGIFLLLLYNSPSGLVIYWTCNNIFSLCKNIIQKTKYPKQILLAIIAIICFALAFSLLFIHEGLILKRVFLSLILVIIPFIPFVFYKIRHLFKSTKKDKNNYLVIFVISQIGLFILGGLVIPSSLIASSVQEFSFIENYYSTFPFILNTAVQSIGIFLLWPLLMYFMVSDNTKRKIAKTSAIFTWIALINVFLFVGDLGNITTSFIFSGSVISSFKNNLLNLFVITVIAIIIFFLTKKFIKIVVNGLVIASCALIILFTLNLKKINSDSNAFKVQLTRDNTKNEGIPYFKFSKEGKNVLLIMLDAGVSGYLPYIFEEKPELKNSFAGFNWYKNCISFGGVTLYGAPGVFGGYEYTPLEMQKRNDVPLIEKHNEALLLLPCIFIDNGFEVFIADPSYANYSLIPDLSIFADYPRIHANNIIGKFTNKWLIEKNDEEISINTVWIIKSYMMRFSIFKLSPLFLRNSIYDDGKWLVEKNEKNGISKVSIDNYSSLFILPDITHITEEKNNNYNVLSNELPHDPIFFKIPEYIPSLIITDKGCGPFAHASCYHGNMASLLLLGKWFDFLKENNVYDNTRIIIVSDHGNNRKFPGLITLPDDLSLQKFASLLLVKNFNSDGDLAVDDSFMTNADVPLLALEGIVENPVNPWTKKVLTSEKENGVLIVTAGLPRAEQHPKYQFNIKPYEWLHIRDNIFDIENWTKVEK